MIKIYYIIENTLDIEDPIKQYSPKYTVKCEPFFSWVDQQCTKLDTAANFSHQLPKLVLTGVFHLRRRLLNGVFPRRLSNFMTIPVVAGAHIWITTMLDSCYAKNIIVIGRETNNSNISELKVS